MEKCVYRACEVDGEEATFHCWEHYSDVIASSVAVGGHCSGQVSQVFGIVEFKDGTVRRIQPHKIRFIPFATMFKRKKVE